jgi:hypothetical protein
MGKMAATWWQQASEPISLFTLGLILVGLAQLLLFLWQLRLIRESLTDAKEAAQAGTAAANAASRQAKVAEESLAKLERPYLFVFNVSPLKVKENEQEYGHWLTVTYTVANYGKIPAVIKHAQAGLSVFTEPQSPPPLDYHHNMVASPIFAAGEARPDNQASMQWDGGVLNDEYENLFPDLGKEELFFWVIITYRGPFSDQHETRACWRYDEDTNRFIGPHGGREYSGEK